MLYRQKHEQSCIFQRWQSICRRVGQSCPNVRLWQSKPIPSRCFFAFCRGITTRQPRIDGQWDGNWGNSHRVLSTRNRAKIAQYTPLGRNHCNLIQSHKPVQQLVRWHDASVWNCRKHAESHAATSEDTRRGPSDLHPCSTSRSWLLLKSNQSSNQVGTSTAKPTIREARRTHPVSIDTRKSVVWKSEKLSFFRTT